MEFQFKIGLKEYLIEPQCCFVHIQIRLKEHKNKDSIIAAMAEETHSSSKVSSGADAHLEVSALLVVARPESTGTASLRTPQTLSQYRLFWRNETVMLTYKRQNTYFSSYWRHMLAGCAGTSH